MEGIAEGASEPEKTQLEHKLTVLTWHLDNYLEKCVGLEFWDIAIRPFKLPTDKMVIPGDPIKTPRVLVTVTSEAFGQVICANCRDKWLAQFAFQKGKSKKLRALPKYDKDKPETHKYQNQWSNSRTGAVSGGGWSKGALTYLNERIKAVKAFRDFEAKSGNKTMEFGKNLIKKANEIAFENTEPAAKKQKPNPKGTEKAKDEVDLTVLDE